MFAIAVDEDDCAGSPCYHGATCIDRVAGYECRCPGEFSGVNCQLGKLSTVEPLTQGFPNWCTRTQSLFQKARRVALSKAVLELRHLLGTNKPTHRIKCVGVSPHRLSIIVICVIK